MGIRGLTTFINKQWWVFDRHELHDTKVVIDGNNLYHFLYEKSKNASFFGGDYEDYIFHTETFFKQFELCKITPIIIFDGASGENKMDCLKRSYASSVAMFCCETNEIYSMCIDKKISAYCVLLGEVFEEIMTEMNIKFIRSLFEADDDIAAVAKILRCPVVSMDSDFFIYNNDYVPLKKIQVGFEQGQSPGTYVKKCRLFKPHFLHKVYPNLDLSTLPLLSTLLGNDYCQKEFFSEFYDSIKGETDLEDEPLNLARIELVFKWLENKTLYQAVDQLFHLMPKEKHEKMLDVMEHIFGILKIFPVNLLEALGFPEEEIERILELRKKEPQSILEPFHHRIEKKEEEKKKEVEDSKVSFLDKIPRWFKEELFAGRHQRVISSLLIGELGMEYPYPQNYVALPNIRCITHPIIKLIHRLITKGVIEYQPFEYFGPEIIIDKENDCEILRCKPRLLEGREIIPPETLPPLHELKDLSFKERKVIMNEALGVTAGMGLDLLSKPWQFFVAIVVYWLKEDVKPKRNKFHAFAAVFLALKSIAEMKLKGQQESWRRGGRNSSENNLKDDCLESALADVTKNDCSTIKRYFNEKSGEDSQPPKYENVRLNVIHVYNMFQYCLKDLTSLNKILGNVYENPSLKYLLSGSLFYNLYEDFRGRPDIDVYVKEKLQNSPSLLRVFMILMKQVKKMCDVELKLKLFSKISAPVMSVSQSTSSTVPRNMFLPSFIKK